MKKRVLALITMLIMVVSIAGCSDKSEVIKISHKNYTEQRITGQLFSVYLESKGFKTEVKELGGTMLCYNALKTGDIDLYPEFTGSAYSAVFKQTEMLPPQETYNYVKENCEKQDGITWLEPLGWNNTYVLSVRPDTAEKLGIKTISDLVEHSKDLTIGCNVEFLERTDGLPGLKEAYPGLEFKGEVSMDQGLTYAALKDGELDVNSSFSTDGRIAKFGFVNLEDDKNFFPPFFVTPILRVDFAKENPEVVKALEELGNKWNDEEMQKYNLMVDEGADVREVATLMLKDKGLIE